MCPGRHRWVIYTTEMNGKNTLWEVDGSMVPAEWCDLQCYRMNTNNYNTGSDLRSSPETHPLRLSGLNNSKRSSLSTPLPVHSSGIAGCTAWQMTPPPHIHPSQRSSWLRSTSSTWVVARSSTCPTPPPARRSTNGFHPKPELSELWLHVCKLLYPASVSCVSWIKSLFRHLWWEWESFYEMIIIPHRLGIGWRVSAPKQKYIKLYFDESFGEIWGGGGTRPLQCKCHNPDVVTCYICGTVRWKFSFLEDPEGKMLLWQWRWSWKPAAEAEPSVTVSLQRCVSVVC